MKLFKILGCLLCFSLLSACGDSGSDSEASKQLDQDSPPAVALHFFEAILQKNDMATAKQFATGSVQRVMAGYPSAKSYARTVLNMNFEKVEITVDRSGQSVREFYKDRTIVVMNFTGYRDGGKISQFREVVMLEVNGVWKVGDIKADPFARTSI